MTGSENDHENMAIWLGFPTTTELGGKIIFPKNHDIGVETFQGSALFWYSKFKNGFDDERTQFARCPIIQGKLRVTQRVFVMLRGRQIGHLCSILKCYQ